MLVTTNVAKGVRMIVNHVGQKYVKFNTISKTVFILFDFL